MLCCESDDSATEEDDKQSKIYASCGKSSRSN